MGITLHRAVPVDQPVAGPVVVTQRVYWDQTKTRLLEEGHPDARFLAYAAGTQVPAALAEQVGLTALVRSAETVPIEPVEPTPPPVPDPGVPEKPARRTRARGDRHAEPGVVADTSIDGEAHILVPEPGSPLRNGVDK
jgi:hypothetical protein